MFVLALIYIAFQYLLSVVAPWFSGWNAGFTFEESGFGDGIPRWIGGHANFDGYHYTQIATHGYGLHEEAFFPVYPLFIRGVNMILMANPIYVALGISMLSFIALTYIWQRNYLHFSQTSPITIKQTQIPVALILLLASPGAFFFVSAYTESVFILLIGIYVTFYMRGKYVLATIVGIILAMTRLAGVFICIIPGIDLLHHLIAYGRISWSKLVAAIVPVSGLGMYMYYLWITTGNPLEFVAAQKGFGNARSSTLVSLPQVYYRYFKIFLTADRDIAYFVAIVEIIVCTTALIVLSYYLYRFIRELKYQHFKLAHISRTALLELSLVMFSLANLILPTLTGTLSSIPRYALASVALPLVVARYFTKESIWAYAVISLALQIAIAVLFFQGHFTS